MEDPGIKKLSSKVDEAMDTFGSEIFEGLKLSDKLTEEQKKASMAIGMSSLKIPTPSEFKVNISKDGPKSTLSSMSWHSRWLWHWDEILQASRTNKACRKVFRSGEAITKERRRQLTQNRYIIHPFSPFRWYWDLIMVITLLLTLIVMPIEIAFYTDDLESKDWRVVNIFVDVVFIMDIFLNFRTAYLHTATEEVILKNKKIAIHYIKTWFIIDFLSSVPFDYLYMIFAGDNQAESLWLTLKMLRLTKLLSLLRILRVARLLRYMHKLEEILDVEGKVLSICNLVLVILFFCHWNGCVQYLVAFISDFPPNSWAVAANLTGPNATTWDRYAISTWRAMSHMLSIGYGQQPPTTNGDTWLLIFSMTLGSTFYALFIAHMSSIILTLDCSGMQFEEKLSQVKEYMKFRRIPLPVQIRVLEYYEHKYQRKFFDEQGILQEPNMSRPLRTEIYMHNCKNLVEKVPFLSSAPADFLFDIIQRLSFQVYFPGDIIIQGGVKGDCMYFIEHGRVEIKLLTGKTVNSLTDGSHFGEIALVLEERRVASVVAAEVCDIYVLKKVDFDTALEDHPKMRTVMERVARQRLSVINENLAHGQIENLDSGLSLPKGTTDKDPDVRRASRITFSDEAPAEKPDDTSTEAEDQKSKYPLPPIQVRSVPKQEASDLPDVDAS